MFCLIVTKKYGGNVVAGTNGKLQSTIELTAVDALSVIEKGSSISKKGESLCFL